MSISHHLQQLKNALRLRTAFTDKMATLLPPPKRPKIYHGIPEPPKELPAPAPNVVVHFVSEEDGKGIAPAVQLPADVSRQDLEMLVNKLSNKVCLVLESLA